MVVLCGLMLSGMARAADIKVDDSRPVKISSPASRVVAEKVIEDASSVPVKQGLVYKVRPRIAYDNEMLAGQPRQAKIKLLVGIDGKVEAVQILEPTGQRLLDYTIALKFKRAQFYPYLEHGVAIPVYMIEDLVFELAEQE